MNIDLISCGDEPPHNLNVIIEVPTGGEPVKYEFDKASGALFVDRILHTPMRYPANYGFVPHTLSPDGDPLDALDSLVSELSLGMRKKLGLAVTTLHDPPVVLVDEPFSGLDADTVETVRTLVLAPLTAEQRRQFRVAVEMRTGQHVHR